MWGKYVAMQTCSIPKIPIYFKALLSLESTDVKTKVLTQQSSHMKFILCT